MTEEKKDKLRKTILYITGGLFIINLIISIFMM